MNVIMRICILRIFICIYKDGTKPTCGRKEDVAVESTCSNCGG